MIITIHNGMIQSVREPDGTPVAADVRDYDIQGMDPDGLKTDEHGQYYWSYTTHPVPTGGRA